MVTRTAGHLTNAWQLKGLGSLKSMYKNQMAMPTDLQFISLKGNAVIASKSASTSQPQAISPEVWKGREHIVLSL